MTWVDRLIDEWIKYTESRLLPPSLSLAASNINKESKREDERKRYRKEKVRKK